MADMETRGIWFEMLCCMWDSPERGTLTGTFDELARLIGCDVTVLKRTMCELERLNIADVTTCHDRVTVVNRRMSREEKSRKNVLLRVRRHRQKQPCNAHVTDVSSSSKKKDISREISEKKVSGGEKKLHGDFVKLTDREYEQLTAQYGTEYIGHLIERMNNHIGSRGTRYVSHFYTLKQWALKDMLEGKAGAHSTRGTQKCASTGDEKQRCELSEKREKDTKGYLEYVLKTQAADNSDFRKKVIEPLADECNERSWKLMIDPLVVVNNTEDVCVIFSDYAVWVEEHYRARIEEKLGEKAVITGETPG